MTGVYAFPSPERAETPAEHLANAEAAEALAAMMRAEGAATLGELFAMKAAQNGTYVRLSDDPEEVVSEIVEKRGIGYAVRIAEAVVAAWRDGVNR